MRSPTAAHVSELLEISSFFVVENCLISLVNVDSNDVIRTDLLIKQDSDGKYRWSIFHENIAYWFDNFEMADGTNNYPRNFVPKKNFLEDKIWRHIAVTFDETTDNLLVYYDGALALKTPFGSSIRLADSPSAGSNMTLGRQGPDWLELISL